MKKIELFISAPIAGVDKEQEYIAYRKNIIRLLEDAAQQVPIQKIHSVISEISSRSKYDSPEESANSDLEAISKSTHFILFYPCRVASSVLIELGYALALKKRTLIVATCMEDLPYMAQGLQSQRFNTSYLIAPLERVTAGDMKNFLIAE